MNENARRLSPEEIQARFPKMLAAHSRKKARAEERKNMREFREKAETVKVAANLGDNLRTAYRNGMRLRGNNGRFMGLPKES